MILPPIRMDGALDFLKDSLGYVLFNSSATTDVNDGTTPVPAMTPLFACRNSLMMQSGGFDGLVGGIFGVDIYLRNLSAYEQNVELSLDSGAGYVAFATCSTPTGDYLMSGEIMLCGSHLDGGYTTGNKVTIPNGSMGVENTMPKPLSYTIAANSAVSMKVQVWLTGKACLPGSKVGVGQGTTKGGCSNGMLYRFAVSPVLTVKEDTGAISGSLVYGPKTSGSQTDSCAGTKFPSRWLGMNTVIQSNPVLINGGRPF